ncbi:hypothetical protein pb186bvf_019076 [Paramecium bursaria]
MAIVISAEHILIQLIKNFSYLRVNIVLIKVMYIRVQTVWQVQAKNVHQCFGTAVKIFMRTFLMKIQLTALLAFQARIINTANQQFAKFGYDCLYLHNHVLLDLHNHILLDQGILQPSNNNQQSLQ